MRDKKYVNLPFKLWQGIEVGMTRLRQRLPSGPNCTFLTTNVWIVCTLEQSIIDQ
jgi:hypothetical protein